MPHVLLFETDRDKVPHLVFLLKLAGVDCTLSRSLDETLNWLSAERLAVAHFDLLLLGSLDAVHDVEPFWRAVSTLHLPVLCFDRQDQHHSVDYIWPQLTFCHPDHLLASVRALTDATTSLLSRESRS